MHAYNKFYSTFQQNVVKSQTLAIMKDCVAVNVTRSCKVRRSFVANFIFFLFPEP